MNPQRCRLKRLSVAGSLVAALIIQTGCASPKSAQELYLERELGVAHDPLEVKTPLQRTNSAGVQFLNFVVDDIGPLFANFHL